MEIYTNTMTASTPSFAAAAFLSRRARSSFSSARRSTIRSRRPASPDSAIEAFAIASIRATRATCAARPSC